MSLVAILGLTAYIITFLGLWPYRVWIAVSVFSVLFLVISVGTFVKARGSINEQHLRHKRVMYRHELPLDECGAPYYMPEDTEMYPTRPAIPHLYQSGYQKQGGYFGED